MWATVLFGALPGTPLLLVVMAMQYNEVIQLLSVDGVSDVFEYVIGLLGHAGWFVLAALGIVGLWRVALQIRFVGRTNFYLLTAALVVLVPIVTPIIADAMYFRHSESVFVMVFLSPVVTSFAHLVAMVILHARNKPN